MTLSQVAGRGFSPVIVRVKPGTVDAQAARVKMALPVGAPPLKSRRGIKTSRVVDDATGLQNGSPLTPLPFGSLPAPPTDNIFVVDYQTFAINTPLVATENSSVEITYIPNSPNNKWEDPAAVAGTAAPA